MLVFGRGSSGMTTELDEIGMDGIVNRIKEVVGDRYVYLSIDIDVLGASSYPLCIVYTPQNKS